MTKNYDSMSNDGLEKWFNIYFNRMTKVVDKNWRFGLKYLNPQQTKWFNELKEIGRVSKERKTYHHRAIDKYIF